MLKSDWLSFETFFVHRLVEFEIFGYFWSTRIDHFKVHHRNFGVTEAVNAWNRKRHDREPVVLRIAQEETLRAIHTDLRACLDQRFLSVAGPLHLLTLLSSHEEASPALYVDFLAGSESRRREDTVRLVPRHAVLIGQYVLDDVARVKLLRTL